MLPIWMVGLIVVWIGLALLVVAVCISARRIDEGLGQRAALAPAGAESSAAMGVEVE